MLQAVSYFNAWSQWWSGELDPNTLMWGIPIFAWERIGKLLGFAGGLTVILDIVGAARVRDAGKRIRNLITVQDTLNRMLYSILFATRHIIFMEDIVYAIGSSAKKIYLANGSTRRKASFDRLCGWFYWHQKEEKLREVEDRSDQMIEMFVYCASVVAIFVFVVVAEQKKGIEILFYFTCYMSLYILFTVYVLETLLTIFAPTTTACILVIFSLILVVIDFIIDRLADVMDHPANDKLLRTVGVVLFLLGFHFDMLGS